jgi:hypothetical protein
MTKDDKSSLPGPISLTLEEAMQVGGGATAASVKFTYTIIGRPWNEVSNPVQVPSIQASKV